MDHPILESPAAWIIRFCPHPPPSRFSPYSMHNHGRTVLVSGHSRITYHPVLDSPATRIISFCARRWGPMNGVAILKEHLFFTLCYGGLSISNDDHYFNSKLLCTDKHPSPSSLINDKNTKQKHDTNQLPLRRRHAATGYRLISSISVIVVFRS